MSDKVPFVPPWVEKAQRKGHNAHDPLCTEYQGEFTGVDLYARCQICNKQGA